MPRHTTAKRPQAVEPQCLRTRIDDLLERIDAERKKHGNKATQKHR